MMVPDCIVNETSFSSKDGYRLHRPWMLSISTDVVPFQSHWIRSRNHGMSGCRLHTCVGVHCVTGWLCFNAEPRSPSFWSLGWLSGGGNDQLLSHHCAFQVSTYRPGIPVRHHLVKTMTRRQSQPRQQDTPISPLTI